MELSKGEPHYSHSGGHLLSPGWLWSTCSMQRVGIKNVLWEDNWPQGGYRALHLKSDLVLNGCFVSAYSVTLGTSLNLSGHFLFTK